MKRLSLVLFVCFIPSLWGQSSAPSNSTTPSGGGILVKGLKLLEPADPAPISARERFKNYVINTVGPLPIVGSSAAAGLQQWRDSPHEWGQGGEGFGTRFGSNMGYLGVRQ